MAEKSKRSGPRVCFELKPTDDLSRFSPVVQELLLRAERRETYASMAKAVGVPIGTVRSRLSRARSRLLEARISAADIHGSSE